MRAWPIYLAMLLPVLALAEHNNLVNPGFDTNLAGWDNPFSRPVAWFGVDSNGDPSSGSALVTNDMNPSNGGTPLALTQCLAVLPGQRIRYGGDMFVPASAPLDTYASVLVRTYSEPGCTEGIVDVYSVFVFDTGLWVSAFETVQVGPGIVSAAVFVGVTKPVGVTADANAWFDDILLDLDTLFEDGFEPTSN